MAVHADFYAEKNRLTRTLTASVHAAHPWSQTAPAALGPGRASGSPVEPAGPRPAGVRADGQAERLADTGNVSARLPSCRRKARVPEKGGA